eukprot:scaffold37343_cov51-Phaeocystis_antarctica.AAC.3
MEEGHMWDACLTKEEKQNGTRMATTTTTTGPPALPAASCSRRSSGGPSRACPSTSPATTASRPTAAR